MSQANESHAVPIHSVDAQALKVLQDGFAAVHDIAMKLAGRGNVQEILDTATRLLVETMHLRASGIRLLDEDTGVLRIASVCNLSNEYLDKGAISATQSPIDVEALGGKTVYVRDVRTDPRTRYREKSRKEGLVSALVTPLRSSGRPIGVLRAYMGHEHEFSCFDVGLMEALASQTAAAIVNARLRRDARDAERLERQVKLAGEVQRRMFPRRLPANPHYQFGCIYEPSFDLGGDFYDLLEFPEGEVGVVIADVIGKGIPASLMMASARSAIRGHIKCTPDLAEVMSEVNRRLCHDTLNSEFLTAFYGVLSPDGRRLRYCNAGHEPLILMREGKIRTLDVGGLVLGIDPSARYEWAEHLIKPNDLLVLITDGIIEALDFDDRAYGRDRLHDSILRHGADALGHSPDFIAKQLLWDVRRFTGLAKLADDITLVVTRVS